MALAADAIAESRQTFGWKITNIGFFEPNINRTNNTRIIGYLVYYRDINAFLEAIETAADLKAKRKILTQNLESLFRKIA